MSSGPVKHHWNAGGTWDSSFLVLDLVARRATGGLGLDALAGGGGGTSTGRARGATSLSGSSGTSMILCAGIDEEERGCFGMLTGTMPDCGGGRWVESQLTATGTGGSTLACGATLTGAGTGSFGTR